MKRAPARRPWLLLAAALLAAAACGWLVTRGLLAWPLALTIGLLTTLAALLVHVVTVLHRQISATRRLARGVERIEARLTRQSEADKKRLDRVTQAQQAHRDDIATLRDEARARKKELHDFIRTKFGNLAQHVTRQGRVDYEQAVAWQQLRDLLRPERAMPSLRGWAAAPDVMVYLVEAIRDRKPGLVVECGSGASSVWLALALRRFGGGRLVSLENDERCAELTRDLLAAHGLADIAEVRHAPLVPWTGANGAASTPWYDLAAVADLADIDLLFVDGPRGRDAVQARYPAGPVLIPRCSGGGVIVLDDADRDDDRAASDRWLESFSFLRRDTLSTEKGTHVFRRD